MGGRGEGGEGEGGLLGWWEGRGRCGVLFFLLEDRFVRFIFVNFFLFVCELILDPPSPLPLPSSR